MKNTPHVLAFLTAMLLLFTACSPTLTPIPPVNLPPAGAPTDASAPGAQPANPTSAPGGPSNNQGQPSDSGPVSIRVDTPQDGAVVNTPQIEVSGMASAGAVVTVNDNIIIVGADGQFKTTIALDEGPNLIEIIASNDSGSETSVELTVTYEP
ncbi:MAG: hypothetical protein HY258_13265 [Chloroflexi bacterium]|nr:hypothetical protein [Chloroflexota bacterium]